MKKIHTAAQKGFFLTKKAKKFINYSIEFKLIEVKKYLEEDMSYAAITKELGLYDHKHVSRLVKNINELGLYGLNDHRSISQSPFKGRQRGYFNSSRS